MNRDSKKLYLQFIEPHPTGGNSLVTISKDDAITFQKRHAYKLKAFIYSDWFDALQDFVVANWAWEVDECDRGDR